MMERYFEVDVDDFIMFGRVDRVDKIPEGFELIEYKGGKSVMTKEHMQEDLQLVFYYVGLKRGYNIEPVRFTYYFLRSNTTVSVECVPEQMQKGLVMIKEVVEKIREEKEFSPKLNDFCPSCDYNVICPLRCKIPLELGGEPPFEEEEEGWQEDAQSVEKGP
jgi:CRISPR/Cas system-associated exonuclease Cas4 (RecB family)